MRTSNSAEKRQLQRLTGDQVEDFEKRGFLKSLPVFQNSEITTLQATFEKLAARLPNGIDINQVNMWHKCSRAFYDKCFLAINYKGGSRWRSTHHPSSGPAHWKTARSIRSLVSKTTPSRFSLRYCSVSFSPSDRTLISPRLLITRCHGISSEGDVAIAYPTWRAEQPQSRAI